MKELTDKLSPEQRDWIMKLADWLVQLESYTLDDFRQALTANTAEDEFDPAYYWEHMSEEHKHSICEKIDNQITQRKIEDFERFAIGSEYTFNPYQLAWLNWIKRWLEQEAPKHDTFSFRL